MQAVVVGAPVAWYRCLIKSEPALKKSGCGSLPPATTCINPPQCLGFVDCKATVTDMSWLCFETGTNYLFITTVGGNVIRVCPPEQAAVNLQLSNQDVQKALIKIYWTPNAVATDPRSTADKQYFFVVTEDKKLKRYLMPERTVDPDMVDDGDITQPKEEFRCHEKPAVAVRVSHDGKLATGGSDGIATVRSLDRLKQAKPVRGHDPWKGGITKICFSTDGHFLFTCGGSTILCHQIGDGTAPATADEDRELSPFAGFPNALKEMREPTKPETDLFSQSGDKKAISGSASPAGDRGATEKKLSIIKRSYTALLNENASLAEGERLPDEDLILNTEELTRLREQAAHEVEKLRTMIREENVAKDMLVDRLKTEFWDSQEDHALVIMAFKRRLEVANYPLRKRSPAELALRRQLLTLRHAELIEFRCSVAAATGGSSAATKPPAVSTYFAGSMRALCVKAAHASPPKPQKRGARVAVKEAPAPQQQPQQPSAADADSKVTGEQSQLPQQAPTEAEADAAAAQEEEAEEDEPLAETRAYLYHAFDLNTTLRKRTQIQLLHFIIYEIKKAFNEEVMKFMEQKRDTIVKIEERTARLKELMDELKEQTPYFQPKLLECEVPDSVFTIRDDEIKAEKIFGQTGNAAGAATGQGGRPREDDSMQRALRQMMGGRLDGKLTESFDMQEERPEYIVKRDQGQTLSEEEQRAVKEYEKKLQIQKDEKQKHIKALESEFKKLEKSIEELCIAFDDHLQELANKRVATDQQICEEELKVIKLSTALLNQEENAKQDALLTAQLDLLKKKKTKSASRIQDAKSKLEQAKVDLATKQAAERAKESDFKFFVKAEREDVVASLLRIYKYRKRGQVHVSGHDELDSGNAAANADVAATGSAPTDDPFASQPESEAASRLQLQPAHGKKQSDDLNLVLGIEKPPELDEVTWERVLDFRTQKIKAELEVARANERAHDAERHLLLEQEKGVRTKHQLDNAVAQLLDFRRQQTWDTQNLEMLFKLKQGQVEVEQAAVVTSYEDCVVLESSIIEQLNAQIRFLAKEKVKLLTEMKNTKKGIKKKKWENQGLEMQVEDLQEKTKFFQLLRVTKALQEFLKGGGEERQAQEIASVERRAEHRQKTHAITVAEIQQKIDKLAAALAEKQQENEALQGSKQELAGAVSERQKIQHIQSQTTQIGGLSEERLRHLRYKRRLENAVRQQEGEIQELRDLVTHLRQRNYPMFNMLAPDQL
eukprot:TRINITY_DN2847_c0_g1_i2.p1 TRINITY_DN2847_c0_g1~~TRINITY_DN2847_c0_g1_i2.p1  ORF type:complete len:1233 (-),score=406.96 TRINITY_DN2847_c0_g1_i2:217-3915(-)